MAQTWLVILFSRYTVLYHLSENGVFEINFIVEIAAKSMRLFYGIIFKIQNQEQLPMPKRINKVFRKVPHEQHHCKVRYQEKVSQEWFCQVCNARYDQTRNYC